MRRLTHRGVLQFSHSHWELRPEPGMKLRMKLCFINHYPGILYRNGVCKNNDTFVTRVHPFILVLSLGLCEAEASSYSASLCTLYLLLFWHEAGQERDVFWWRLDHWELIVFIYLFIYNFIYSFHYHISDFLLHHLENERSNTIISERLFWEVR